MFARGELPAAGGAGIAVPARHSTSRTALTRRCRRPSERRPGPWPCRRRRGPRRGGAPARAAARLTARAPGQRPPWGPPVPGPAAAAGRAGTARPGTLTRLARRPATKSWPWPSCSYPRATMSALSPNAGGADAGPGSPAYVSRSQRVPKPQPKRGGRPSFPERLPPTSCSTPEGRVRWLSCGPPGRGSPR